MQAIVHTEYGPPEVLALADVPKPEPGLDELLIRVHAVEATKADCELRSFRFPVKWFWLPLRFVFGITKPKRPIPGGYFAGVVEDCGRDARGFAIGDEVFGTAGLRLSTYAEYVCLPADYTIVRKPGNISFEEAATVPLGGLNALHFMRRARIEQGAKVLVIGAGGSIGTYAVQIARAMGAEVTAVDSGIKESMLRQIGAAHFVDYRTESINETGRTFDVILNMVAGSSFVGCIRLLRPGGRYLTANPRVWDMFASVLLPLLSKKRAIFAFAAESAEELRALSDMIESGTLKPTVDRVYPLADAAEAHRRVESEERLGSVVLGVADQYLL